MVKRPPIPVREQCSAWGCRRREPLVACADVSARGWSRPPVSAPHPSGGASTRGPAMAERAQRGAAAENPRGALVPSAARRRRHGERAPVRPRCGAGPPTATGRDHRRLSRSRRERPSTAQGSGRPAEGRRRVRRRRGAALRAHGVPAHPWGLQCGVGRGRAAPCGRAGTCPEPTREHAAHRAWTGPGVFSTRARATCGRRESARTPRPAAAETAHGRAAGPLWAPRGQTACPPMRGRLAPAGQRRRTPAPGARDGGQGGQDRHTRARLWPPPGRARRREPSGAGAPWRC